MSSCKRTVVLGLVLVVVVAGAKAFAFVHLRQIVSVPMRDGRSLAADLFLPAASGQWPVVVIQTPYNRLGFVPVFVTNASADPLLKSPHYAFLVVDWRGFYGSADAAYAGSPTRGQDGHDVVQWAAAQPWCTGAVGTWGASALGLVQFLTAIEQPAALKGCVPIVASYRTWYESMYGGGVYLRNINGFINDYFLGGTNPALNHPYRDAFWTITEGLSDRDAQLTVPMLHVGGWYDHNIVFTLAESGLIQTGGGLGAAGNQKVIIGPWSHGRVGQVTQNEQSYPAAEHAGSAAALEFFDHVLRGQANGYPSQPVIRYFRMNDDAWRTAAAWPPPGTVATDYYMTIDGGLDLAAPVVASTSRSYVADPASPVPTVCGAIIVETSATQGPCDLSSLESRPDVLAFSTPPLSAPLTIEGESTATLWITCTTTDTDIMVRMTPVSYTHLTLPTIYSV